MDDPKQLFIGVALYSLTGEIRGAGGTSTVPMVFETGRRHRGICRNPGRNARFPLQYWLLYPLAEQEFRGGWPGE